MMPDAFNVKYLDSPVTTHLGSLDDVVMDDPRHRYRSVWAIFLVDVNELIQSEMGEGKEPWGMIGQTPAGAVYLLDTLRWQESARIKNIRSILGLVFDESLPEASVLRPVSTLPRPMTLGDDYECLSCGTKHVTTTDEGITTIEPLCVGCGRLSNDGANETVSAEHEQMEANLPKQEPT